MSKPKLLRITTVPISLKNLLKGQHRFMSDYFDVLGVSSEDKELKEAHLNEGIRVEALEMTRTVSPIADLKSLWKFYKLCKREKPTIVHSHTPKAGIIGMLGAKLAGVPIRLHTVAGLPLMEVTGLKRKILDFVEKLTYSSATKVYPNSKGLYDFILENNYVSASKLHVIGQGSSNGIDTSHFNPEIYDVHQKQALRKELNIAPEDFVYVFVGRLVNDKGVNELVAAFQKVNQLNRDTKLLLLGLIEDKLDPLKSVTLEAMKTNPNIIYVGFQQDVRPYLAISNVLVFPSYREGFPNVVMQASAMGLLSIVSNINGCNEIIIEGKNGTIIPVKNIAATVEAMLKIYTNTEYYNTLKSNARTMIVNRYEQQVVWEALLEEYNRLLIKKGFNPVI